MIVFTAIGVLWFWMLCFEIGFVLIPTLQVVRAGWALWLFGREAGHVVAMFAAARVQEVDHG